MSDTGLIAEIRRRLGGPYGLRRPRWDQRISFRSTGPGRWILEVNGRRVVTRKVSLVALPGHEVAVRAELLGFAHDFDAEGRFVPLLDLADVETEAARDVYERLKRRFGADD